MWIQFFLENGHFALTVFAALTTFAVAWLYFDAWMVKHSPKEGIRAFGYILLSLSFIVHASDVESAVLTTTLIPAALHTVLFLGIHLGGYACIIVSLLLDPIQPKPNYTQQSDTLPLNGQQKEPLQNQIPAQTNTPAISSIPLRAMSIPTITGSIPSGITPFLALTIAGMYLHRSTTGLERHLTKVGISFLLLGVSEIIGLRILFLNSPNVDVYNLVIPFGPLWFFEHLFLAASVGLLSQWVFGYLLKRFQTQLFMIFVSIILGIFLITTVTFTALLVNNLVTESLTELETDTKVLNMAIDSKKAESLSNAALISQDPRIQTGIAQNDRRSVADVAAAYLLNKKQSTLLILDRTGKVIGNGEDTERYGDSLSGNLLVKRAMDGEEVAAITTLEGILSPAVQVRAAVPIKNNGQIVGVVLSGNTIDTALLDGIKKATGLDASLYGGNTLSATTLVTSDGISRPIGIKEENAVVKNAVLSKGTAYTGSITLLNRPFFASYLPLLDTDNTPVGMIMVGKPQIAVLQTASRSIELTFLVTTLLLLLTPLPAFFIATSIAKQVQ